MMRSVAVPLPPGSGFFFAAVGAGMAAHGWGMPDYAGRPGLGILGTVPGGTAMRIILTIVAIALGFVSTALRAQPVDQAYVSSGGHEYALSCNADGYVLTSLAPVSRFRGRVADTQVTKRTEVLYLGQSCDSFLDEAGTGSWGWANGGFGAEFDTGLRVMFPRQELVCAPERPYVGNCRW